MVDSDKQQSRKNGTAAAATKVVEVTDADCICHLFVIFLLLLSLVDLTYIIKSYSLSSFCFELEDLLLLLLKVLLLQMPNTCKQFIFPTSLYISLHVFGYMSMLIFACFMISLFHDNYNTFSSWN